MIKFFPMSVSSSAPAIHSPPLEKEAETALMTLYSFRKASVCYLAEGPKKTAIKIGAIATFQGQPIVQGSTGRIFSEVQVEQIEKTVGEMTQAQGGNGVTPLVKKLADHLLQLQIKLEQSPPFALSSWLSISKSRLGLVTPMQGGETVQDWTLLIESLAAAGHAVALPEEASSPVNTPSSSPNSSTSSASSSVSPPTVATTSSPSSGFFSSIGAWVRRRTSQTAPAPVQPSAAPGPSSEEEISIAQKYEAYTQALQTQSSSSTTAQSTSSSASTNGESLQVQSSASSTAQSTSASTSALSSDLSILKVNIPEL